ncbi:hypothetical protein BOX15_Mlig009506g1, partial [Macrostomum lignano]
SQMSRQLELRKLDHLAVTFDHRLDPLLLPDETIKELLGNFEYLENTVLLASPDEMESTSIEYRRCLSDSGQNSIENVARLYALHEVRSFSGGQSVTIDDAFLMPSEAEQCDANDLAEIESLQRALQTLFGVDLRSKIEVSFDVNLAHRVHKLVMPNAQDAGNFRTCDAAPRDSTFQYLNWEQIPAELEVLFNYCSEQSMTTRNRGDAFKLAAVFLERFLLIHPYRDGNGRTSRLLCSVLLMQMDCMKVPLLFNFDKRRNSSGSMTLCRDQYMSALQGARGAIASDTVPPNLLAAFLVLVGDRTLRSWSDLLVVGTERQRHRSSSHKEDEQ